MWSLSRVWLQIKGRVVPQIKSDASYQMVFFDFGLSLVSTFDFNTKLSEPF